MPLQASNPRQLVADVLIVQIVAAHVVRGWFISCHGPQRLPHGIVIQQGVLSTTACS